MTSLYPPHVVASHRVRLHRFYEQAAPSKIADLESTVQKYAALPDGFTMLWTLLARKYPGVPLDEPVAPSVPPPEQEVDEGPLPTTEEITMHRGLLAALYTQVAPEKLPDLEANISRYASQPGGFEKMWTILRKKYPGHVLDQGGVLPAAAAAAEETVAQPPVGAATAAPKPPPPTSEHNGDDAKGGIDKPANRVAFEVLHEASSRREGADEGSRSKKTSSFASTQSQPDPFQAQQHQRAATASVASPAIRTTFDDLFTFSTQSERPPLPPSDLDELHRTRLLRFFLAHAPERVGNVDRHLRVGRKEGYDTMWKSLVETYGPEPPPPPTAGNAAHNEVHQNRHLRYSAAETALWRERVTKFYRLYAPHKTSADIDTTLAMYSPPDGFEQMWRALLAKYGAEQTEPAKGLVRRYMPLPDNDPAQAASPEHLTRGSGEEAEGRADSGRSDGAVDLSTSPRHQRRHHSSSRISAIGGAVHLPSTQRSAGEVGHDWESVGTVSPLSDDALTPPRGHHHHQHRGSAAAAMFGRPPQQTAVSTSQRVESTTTAEAAASWRGADADTPSVVLHALLRFQGIVYSLYDHATVDAQTAFRRAIEREVCSNLGLPGTRAHVAQVSPGVVAELDLSLTVEEAASGAAEALVTRVLLGTFTVAHVRDAYRRVLGGNPMQLHTEGAAIFGGACTPLFGAGDGGREAARPGSVFSAAMNEVSIGGRARGSQGRHDASATAWPQPPLSGSLSPASPSASPDPRSEGAQAVTSHLLAPPCGGWTATDVSSLAAVPDTNTTSSSAPGFARRAAPLVRGDRNDGTLRAPVGGTVVDSGQQGFPPSSEQEAFPRQGGGGSISPPRPTTTASTRITSTIGGGASKATGRGAPPATDGVMVRLAAAASVQAAKSGTSAAIPTQLRAKASAGDNTQGSFLGRLWRENDLAADANALRPFAAPPPGVTSYGAGSQPPAPSALVRGGDADPHALYRTSVPSQSRAAQMYRETHKPQALNATPSTDFAPLTTRTAAPTFTQFQPASLETLHTPAATQFRDDANVAARAHAAALLATLKAPREEAMAYARSGAGTVPFTRNTSDVPVHPGATYATALVSQVPGDGGGMRVVARPVGLVVDEAREHHWRQQEARLAEEAALQKELQRYGGNAPSSQHQPPWVSQQTAPSRQQSSSSRAFVEPLENGGGRVSPRGSETGWRQLGGGNSLVMDPSYDPSPKLDTTLPWNHVAKPLGIPSRMKPGAQNQGRNDPPLPSVVPSNPEYLMDIVSALTL